MKGNAGNSNAEIRKAAESRNGAAETAATTEAIRCPSKIQFSSQANCGGSRLGCVLKLFSNRTTAQSLTVIKDRPGRLSIIYASQPRFFVTFCTRDHASLPNLKATQLALEHYGSRGREESNVSLGAYVIMPDHLHLLVKGDATFSLSEWVKGLKRHISKATDLPSRFWQPGFFDHVLRSDESYDEKCQYVWNNPVRAGLVSRAEDWPYRGNVTWPHELK